MTEQMANTDNDNRSSMPLHTLLNHFDPAPIAVSDQGTVQGWRLHPDRLERFTIKADKIRGHPGPKQGLIGIWLLIHPPQGFLKRCELFFLPDIGQKIDLLGRRFKGAALHVWPKFSGEDLLNPRRGPRALALKIRDGEGSLRQPRFKGLQLFGPQARTDRDPAQPLATCGRQLLAEINTLWQKALFKRQLRDARLGARIDGELKPNIIGLAKGCAEGRWLPIQIGRKHMDRTKEDQL
jgi:hypothetical protein